MPTIERAIIILCFLLAAAALILSLHGCLVGNKQPANFAFPPTRLTPEPKSEVESKLDLCLSIVSHIEPAIDLCLRERHQADLRKIACDQTANLLIKCLGAK